MESSDNSLNIKDSKKFYSYYKNNKYFLDAFANVMLNANNEINKNFKGVSVSIYGRIKSQDSFDAKVEQKLKNDTPNIYDVYAFKIIINKIDRNYRSTNPHINNLQKRLSVLDNKRVEIKSNENLNDRQKNLLKAIDLLTKNIEETLSDLVSLEISQYLTKNNSTFLNDCKAENMPERVKDYNKPNGFLSHQRTLKMHPDPNEHDKCCFVEFQCRSYEADLKAADNHEEFKIQKYGPDASCFPKEDFDKCTNAKEFEELYEKSIPTYVYLDPEQKKVIRCPHFINFMHFYSNYLFEKEVDENGETVFVHQKDLDKINEFSKGFKRDSSYDINLESNTDEPGPDIDEPGG